jgi:hypothetical protein
VAPQTGIMCETMDASMDQNAGCDVDIAMLASLKAPQNSTAWHAATSRGWRPVSLSPLDTAPVASTGRLCAYSF